MATKAVVKKRPPRTVKEKKFVKAYVENGGNGTQAALQAYNANPASARKIASEVLTKLDMSAWLDKAGLTDEVMAGAIAYKSLAAKKQNTFTGEIEDDHRIQLDALKFAAQLKGQIKAGDTLIQNNTQINNTQPLLVKFIQE